MSYCTFVFFGFFFGFSKCEQQSWLALLVNGIVYGSEVAEISGMDFKLKSCWSSSAMVDMEKVVSINSGDLLYRARPPNWSSFPDPADNLLSWLLSTKQLSMLRLGWSCRKTRFCGTQPMFLWRKLSRPKGLRGCWTIGIMEGAKVLPPDEPSWMLVAKRSSSLLLLWLFSWSWLMLIWMARNLLSIELGESGTFDPWHGLRLPWLAFSNCWWP